LFSTQIPLIIFMILFWINDSTWYADK
jgi:hypothetical protein